MHEGTLGVHEIKLVVEPRPCFGNSCGVAQHADSPLHLGKISSGDDSGWLIVDSHFESRRAPVHELNTAFRLYGGDGSVDILGHNISPVEEAAGHVLAVPGVTLHHGIGWLEAGVGDLRNVELLVVSLLGRYDGGVCDKGEMDAGVGNQIGLKLVKVDVESTIKSQGGGNRADDLGDQSVKVGVGGPLDIKVSAADIVDCLVVHHECTITVLESSVGAEGGIVRLHHSSGHLRSRVDTELQLGLLPVIYGEPLHQKGGKPGASSTTEGVEDKEALEAGAVVGELADSVQHKVNNLFANSVVASSVVVGSIFFTADKLLGMKELPVGTSPDLIYHGRFKVEEDSPGNMLSGACLGEKGGEAVVGSSCGLIGGESAVGLKAVLKAIELPAGIAHLDSSLANVNGDTFPHGERLGRYLL